MNKYKNYFSPPKLLLGLLVLILLSHNQVSAQQSQVFNETKPVKKFAVTKSNPYFEIDLGFSKAFDVQITGFSDIANKRTEGFCQAFPSTLEARMDWTGPLLIDEMHSYDNIAYHKGYFFILDSISFQLVVTADVTDLDFYTLIDSDFENEVDLNGDYEEPFLVIGANSILYIITPKVFLTYDLNLFLKAMRSNQDAPIPVINQQFSEYKGYETIFNIVHLDEMLYIAADNIVDVYSTAGNKIKLVKRLDSQFFNSKEVGIVDVVVKGNYAFVLDKLTGLFVVDISKAKEGTFEFKSNLNNVKVSKGQFVEVIGNSINIVSSTSKNPFVEEYIIKGDPEIKEIVFNRKTAMYQAVRDTYSDGNFLYILTGFLNMVFKPSVPSKFDTPNSTEYLSDYWALFGAKAIVSVTDHTKSFVVAVKDDFITAMTFKEQSPYMACGTDGVEHGFYVYKVQARQADCEAKRRSEEFANDFGSTCEIEETILLMMSQDGSNIGNVVKSDQRLNALYVGMGVMALLVLVLFCCFRKSRNEFRGLEDRIKFQRIQSTENEGEGAGNAQDV